MTSVNTSMGPFNDHTLMGFVIGGGVGAMVGLATFITGFVCHWSGVAIFLSPCGGVMGGAVSGTLLALLCDSGMQIKESMNNAPNKSILEHVFFHQTEEGIFKGDRMHPL